VTVYLLRHARAGRRSAWKGDDERRPLSKVGRRQGNGLVDVLADADVELIVSSPFVRCVQSVEPLAKARGLEVDVADELREGAPLENALRLFEKVAGHPTVLCTHGDIVEQLLTHFKANGVKVGKLRMEKGSVWAFETRNGRVTKATYLPPPKP
jgi:broad specificity phosphatase PhoE